MTARILLVDDETNLRRAVSDLLEIEGFAVVGVDDGEAALQALEQGPFDLIVADIVMPNLDGWGLVKRVRADERFHDVPFIFLTARGEPADARQARSLGADDYLGKPFDAEDLLTMVRNRLRRRQDIANRYRDEVARLQELNRVKDEFLALTSHELARPLTAIRGFADLLLRSAGDTSQREFLQLIRQESTAMASLADDLLQLSALERGQPIEREPIAPDQLVREALRPFHVPPMSHRFQMLAGAELPIIRGDHGLLVRALTNLIGNAVKYSARRSVVRVYAHVKGRDLHVEVTDEGIGMPQEALARLGEPFFRVKCEATRGITGTGLGLALVQRIAKAHRGEVCFDSAPGQGTTVTLRLPLA